ncbi:MAG TPA: hypothetical protein VG737_02415 [Cyclobacteriaceae bacterium]|nr:hypothetical protein [Cyclobacteriaceae bacterium]
MAHKLVGITCVCLLSLNIDAFAQIDTVIVISRNGVDAKFAYRKYRTRNELHEIKFPHFSTTKNNISRVTALLNEFTQTEARYNALVKVQHDIDSIHQEKEKKLQETIDLEKQRADNFENTNKELTKQYDALDTTLKNCERLALSTRKESWWRGAKQGGILALAVGVVAGVLIAK